MAVERLFTMRQAANFIGISLRSLQDWIYENSVVFTEPEGAQPKARFYIRESDLIALKGAICAGLSVEHKRDRDWRPWAP